MATKSNDKVISLEILNGPGRWDLIIGCLAEGKEGSFKISTGSQKIDCGFINLKILGMASVYPEALDGNTEWILSGYFINYAQSGIEGKIISELDDPDNFRGIRFCHFCAKFSVKSRQGQIKFKKSAFLKKPIF